MPALDLLEQPDAGLARTNDQHERVDAVYDGPRSALAPEPERQTQAGHEERAQQQVKEKYRAWETIEVPQEDHAGQERQDPDGQPDPDPRRVEAPVPAMGGHQAKEQ